MNTQHHALDTSAPQGPPRRAGLGLPAGFLRLVKGAPERAAIATGQVDAVVDPASGKVFLLPGAQEALHARQARASSLLALAADWTWEQDENYLFTSHAGTAARERGPCEAIVPGKPLWDLGLATRLGLDWRTHRQQLEWRATFRDLELGWTNAAGDTRWLSLDGEPVFDAQDRFRGYRGTLRDITHRERLRTLAQAAVRAGVAEGLGDPPDFSLRRPRDEAESRLNALLAALPVEDRHRVAAELKPVTLTFGEVLFAPGERIRYVYFPTDALVSLSTSVKGGPAMEVGLVGREGMVGVSVALGLEVATVRAVVLQAGGALRISVARFRRWFRDSLSLQAESCRFIHTKLAMARQTAACARFHLVEARLADWLLRACDHIGGPELHFTQDSLAAALGVRRAGITHAASGLQRRRLISYRRGDIHVLDRKGLEDTSCGCYTSMKDIAQMSRRSAPPSTHPTASSIS
jgi:CRP-like cAMP-binding protein/PAS domain-containing protein